MDTVVAVFRASDWSQTQDAIRVVSDLRRAFDIRPADFVHVAPHKAHRLRQVIAQRTGPAAATDRLDEIDECQARVRRRGLLDTAQQGANGNGAVGAALLEQGHRVHAQAGDATGTGVTSEIVRGYGRPGEDESALAGLLVDGVAYIVPNVGERLPLVEQPGPLARENDGGIHGHRLGDVWVRIEKHLAPSRLASRRRLAATLRAFDQHGARRRQTVLKLAVR